MWFKMLGSIYKALTEKYNFLPIVLDFTNQFLIQIALRPDLYIYVMASIFNTLMC